MHLLVSYVTGPSALFFNAPTRHAEAQAGSSQCRHMRRTNFPPFSSTKVNAVSVSFAGCSTGNPCAVWHACSQAWHPMHCLISTSIDFLFSISASLLWFVPLCKEELVDDLLLCISIEVGEHALHW